jgi:hypothetical protein
MASTAEDFCEKILVDSSNEETRTVQYYRCAAHYLRSSLKHWQHRETVYEFGSSQT